MADEREQVSDLREAVLKLTITQEQHAKLLEKLADEHLKNIEFKAKIGGIVIATTLGVSVVWTVIVVALQFWKH
jgi:hypothetical protein